MKEHPIIFSSEMVQAILDGRKTQTRRIIKPQPEASLSRIENSNLWTYTGCDREWKCPCGQSGDRLWVKETAERGWLPHLLTGEPTKHETAVYAADKAPCLEENGFDLMPWWKGPICPARFMPRWVSRITLEITGVRVEQIQDISEEDAVKEGVHDYTNMASPIDFFICLWNKLNGKRGFGWDVNPYVWVIEFKRIEEGKDVEK